ncbi:glycerophosphodiester phosphodiesterase family protein [Actinacidiphila sp. DG2A-62]|jgi:glycerophosphoryl diester phosphodiesterase|uniref:glycerophosphodiester phosphodiesterase n=1 Tax=Actinacidiphila sp. DG2A-62 TaxID=3108821 RepID=UPI002DBBBEC9|nr:glycerophosphodiester phosphodiesterase family protein [Actinacidiphila sp. DG2A-62]MEC3998720.1 glycerophosphodiester phosphodiesterase family protein [Actinacidiphila sp. DG2A-62]
MSFLTVGHRGVMGVEPENTLRSFRRAERAGLDQIELDLHLSKDGELVVMHDATVDRTTDGSGLIRDLTIGEIRGLDAGLGERVPVFQEVLDAVSRPIQAEIKDVAAARVLAGVLRERGETGRVSVLSFHDEALAEVHALLPEVRTVLVSGESGPDLVPRAQAVGARLVSLDLTQLTLAAVRRCHDAGIAVMAWSVNSAQDWALVRALGLDGAATDLPEEPAA